MAGLNHQIHGELKLRIAAQSDRPPQISPIKMKRTNSVRNATLMIVTIRNTLAIDREFMPAHIRRSSSDCFDLATICRY